MKYFTEDIEFTHSPDYFSEEGFLLDGVCYNNVKDGLVSSLVNCTEVIKSYVCKKFSDDVAKMVDKTGEEFLNFFEELNQLEDDKYIKDPDYEKEYGANRYFDGKFKCIDYSKY